MDYFLSEKSTGVTYKLYGITHQARKNRKISNSPKSDKMTPKHCENCYTNKVTIKNGDDGSFF